MLVLEKQYIFIFLLLIGWTVSEVQHGNIYAQRQVLIPLLAWAGLHFTDVLIKANFCLLYISWQGLKSDGCWSLMQNLTWVSCNQFTSNQLAVINSYEWWNPVFWCQNTLQKSFPCHLVLLDFLWTSEEGDTFDAFYGCQHFLAKVAALYALVEKICFYVLKMSS